MNEMSHVSARHTIIKGHFVLYVLFSVKSMSACDFMSSLANALRVSYM